MSVARSYARALLGAAADVGVSGRGLDEMEVQLEQIYAAIEGSPGAKTALFGPVVGSKEKTAVVREIGKKAGAHELLTRFLELLARKGRLALLPEVREAFSRARLESEGGIAGEVTAADPVKAEDVEGLAQAFQKKLGKKVSFKVMTDPSLLAGMKVSVGGVTYDGTLRVQLNRLREKLARGI